LSVLIIIRAVEALIFYA